MASLPFGTAGIHHPHRKETHRMKMNTVAAPLAGPLMLLLLTSNAGNAMNANLACPYGDSCSGPQTPYLNFHSPQGKDMLFNTGEQIEIVCQAGLRAVGLKWTLHRNMVEKPFREGSAEPLPANRFGRRPASRLLRPARRA
jgi:hypothetical protein